MMKSKLLLTVAMASVAGIASAGTITTPYIAGDFNGWNESANALVETGVGTDVWTYTVTGLTANQRQEFKVTDGTWGLTVPGENGWLYADGAGEITITYDGNTYTDGFSPSVDRLGLSTDPGAWTVAGSFQSQIGGGDWDNANPNTAMTHQGGGIYTFSAALAPGTYDGKAVVSGSWDSISWDGRSVNTANNNFTTDAINDTVVFTVDSFSGISKIEVIPEPATLALIGLFGTSLLFARRRFLI